MVSKDKKIDGQQSWFLHLRKRDFFLGQSTSEPISALCSARNLTIVATGNKVCIFQRGKQVCSFDTASFKKLFLCVR